MNRLPFFILLVFLISCNLVDEQKSEQFYDQALQLYMKKKLENAETRLMQAISYNDDFPRAYLLLAKIYFFSGNDDEFIEAIENYLQRTEHNHEGLILYARWHIGKNENKKARDLLNRILACGGTNSKALYLMGSLQLREGKKDSAIQTLNMALHNYFYLSRIHTTLGDIYGELGLDERSNKHKNMAVIIEKFMDGKQ